MPKIRLHDLPSNCWPSLFDQGLQIDRSGGLAPDYLDSLGYEFILDADKADAIIRKGNVSEARFPDFEAEKMLIQKFSTRPSLLLMGEPRQLSPAAYRFAPRNRSLAIAPGSEFKRMYFARPWSDPQTENWKKREDKFCWIGRPWPGRIEWAQRLIKMGVKLDIYSQMPWPLPEWKGHALDDVETARSYKFRIVCENSLEDLYHSEKLFVGIKSGCVCFYLADPKLVLQPEIQGSFLNLTEENIKNRFELAEQVLEKSSKFLFSSSWETYSLRGFIDRMIAALDYASWQQ